MKIEKEKRRVAILCRDDLIVKGYVHINPGERLLEFLNDAKENFIAVTDAGFQSMGSVKSFQLYTKRVKRTGVIFLNKSEITALEESTIDNKG